MWYNDLYKHAREKYSCHISVKREQTFLLAGHSTVIIGLNTIGLNVNHLLTLVITDISTILKIYSSGKQYFSIHKYSTKTCLPAKQLERTHPIAKFFFKTHLKSQIITTIYLYKVLVFESHKYFLHNLLKFLWLQQRSKTEVQKHVSKTTPNFLWKLPFYPLKIRLRACTWKILLPKDALFQLLARFGTGLKEPCWKLSQVAHIHCDWIITVNQLSLSS